MLTRGFGVRQVNWCKLFIQPMLSTVNYNISTNSILLDFPNNNLDRAKAFQKGQVNIERHLLYRTSCAVN